MRREETFGIRRDAILKMTARMRKHTITVVIRLRSASQTRLKAGQARLEDDVVAIKGKLDVGELRGRVEEQSHMLAYNGRPLPVEKQKFKLRLSRQVALPPTRRYNISHG